MSVATSGDSSLTPVSFLINFTWRPLLPYYFGFLLLFIVLPFLLNLNLGIHKIYMKILMLLFESARQSSFHNTDPPDENEPYLPEVDSSLVFPKSKEFHLTDVVRFSSAAIKAIVNDEVTKRFTAEELPYWNLMTRTYMAYHYVNVWLTCIWILGGLFRYFVLLPTRLFLMAVTVIFLLVGTIFLNFISNQQLRKVYIECYSVVFCRLCMASLSVIANFHQLQNKAKSGIVVANHTSPVDMIVLGSGGFFRIVGQLQPGFFSFLQRQLSKMGHVFFERTELCDRSAVADCLKDHATKPDLPPVVIFPEGTCINNTGVMMFRKGTFEVSNVVYPVAIKYNPMFGDPFWNSSASTYGWYLINLSSSWLVYCDVWYLPPISKKAGESAISFASRVQKKIADRANIVHLEWDGNLKRTFVPPYLKYNVQKEYAQSLIIQSSSDTLTSPKISPITTNTLSTLLPHQALLLEQDEPIIPSCGSTTHSNPTHCATAVATVQTHGDTTTTAMQS